MREVKKIKEELDRRIGEKKKKKEKKKRKVEEGEGNPFFTLKAMPVMKM